MLEFLYFLLFTLICFIYHYVRIILQNGVRSKQILLFIKRLVAFIFLHVNKSNETLLNALIIIINIGKNKM